MRGRGSLRLTQETALSLLMHRSVCEWKKVSARVCLIVSESFPLMRGYIKQLMYMYKHIYCVYACFQGVVKLLRRLRPCLLTSPDTHDNSSSLQRERETKRQRERLKSYPLAIYSLSSVAALKHTGHDMYTLIYNETYQEWLSAVVPSGGWVIGGFRQYMWYPLSQSSQNSSWSCMKNTSKYLKLKFCGIVPSAAHCSLHL